jgi:hypothetical protein
MSIGVEYRRVRDNVMGSSTGGPNGTFVFSPGTPLPFSIPSASGQNNLAAGTPSPSSLISFLSGAPAFYTRSLAYPGFGPPGGGFPPFGVRRYHLNGWFQDDFRVTGKLTLNAGLRWEFNSVPYEQANRFSAIVDDPHFKGGSLYRRLVLNPDPLYYPDYRGFGPRTGFAYKVADRTVLRGGFGIFTNLPPTVFPEQAGVGFPFASQSSEANPPYSLTPLPVSGLPYVRDLNGNPVLRNNDTKTVAPNTPVDLRPVQAFFGGPILANFTSLHYRNGYTMSGNFTLEQQLPGDAVLQIGYVFNNAAKLYASEWPNAYTGAPPAVTPYTNVTPGLGEFQLTDNHAHSTYNSLQISLRKVSASHGVQFQMSYTRSKALDNASTVWNGPTTNSALLMNDPTCFRCERGPSVFDVPQRFVLNVGYQLPFGRISHLPKRLTNGWLLSSIVAAQSGFPFTVNSPYGTKEYGTDTYLGFQPTRPDLVQTPTYRQAGDPQEQFFSTAVMTDGTTLGQKYFATPGAATNGVQDHPGNLGRNTFRAPSWSDVDLSLIKDTLINERVTVQFRSEFFNALNQHAFGWPGAVLGSQTFGIFTYTVFPERQIQLALRLIF